MYSIESIQFQGHSAIDLDKCSTKNGSKVNLLFTNTTNRNSRIVSIAVYVMMLNNLAESIFKK